ncbi:MAG: hypothetical protein GF313_03755 [Caldithrix sp.]|nr:hypothetical protein [Caldithrix sp.]
MTQDAVGIMRKLRDEAMPMHRALSDLPYIKALMSHQLTLPSYVNALRALAVIHSVLEEEIEEADSGAVRAVWSDDLRKYPLLQSDLAFFGPRAVGDVTEALDAAVEVTKSIRHIRLDRPVALLGYVYVLEGITLGHRLHMPDITTTFRLKDLDGYRYVNSYGESVHRHWDEFSAKMNAALCDPGEQEAVLEGARELFHSLKGIYTQLYPLDLSKQSRHVTRINPEAGVHPIPERDDEIEAALAASQRGWEAFPYYAARYGERGKRFSDSDTCWLVTLTRLDQESFTRQIDWIARVLASRGMPSIMLEETLRYLEQELRSLAPPDGASYALLGEAANSFRDARLSAMSDQSAREHIVRFERATAGCDGAIGRVGELLVCAATDEANGMDNAIESLRSWLADRDRFGEAWCTSVESTIQAVSAAVRL